jgi:uncharacterized metal-binding protein YceD (DUF177 family)
MTTPNPVEHIYDLSTLSNAGAEIAISATPAQREKLTHWLEAASVEKFSATVTLTKLAPNRFRYDALLVCDLTQPSVVSLEPVKAHVEEEFSRELHITHRGRHLPDKAEELTLMAGDEDVPEEIEGHKYDLAGPLLEELSLALDPYPRAQGEAFADLAEPEDKPDSPFAVLKQLKKDG